MLPANKESVLTFTTRFCRCTFPGRWGEECLEQNLWGQGLDPFCQTQYSHQWVDGLCYPDSNRKGGVLVLSGEVLFFSKQNGLFFPLAPLFQPSFFYLSSPRIPKNVLHHSKWQPTPVFLPGESHGQRSLAGYIVHRVAKSQTQLKWLSTHACTHTNLFQPTALSQLPHLSGRKL